MPRIARQHRADHPLGPKDPYSPGCDWRDDTTVQWGARGVVLGKAPYQTAFFEAFPAAGGFIRGEGATIAEAEANAFAQWRREQACRHAWGRRGYTNGGAKCRHCGAFRGRVFRPIPKLGAWRRPPDFDDLHMIISGWLRPKPDMTTPGDRKLCRARHLRARVAGIDLPPIPAEPMTDDQFMGWVRDPYRESCREAVSAWLQKGQHGLPPDRVALLERAIARARADDAAMAQ